MEKKTPIKRKSLANSNTPAKVQKVVNSPATAKANKTPKSATKQTPQKKEIKANGKQKASKQKKVEEEEDEDELLNDSAENESEESSDEVAENDDSDEGAENDDSDEAEDDDNDDDDNEDDEEEEEENSNDANKTEEGTSPNKKESSPYGIYVGNLPEDIIEEELKNIFEDVTPKKIIVKRSYAFIFFTNEEDFKNALKKNEMDYKGKKISVKVKEDRKPKSTNDLYLKKKLYIQNLKLKVAKLEQELISGNTYLPYFKQNPNKFNNKFQHKPNQNFKNKPNRNFNNAPNRNFNNSPNRNFNNKFVKFVKKQD